MRVLVAVKRVIDSQKYILKQDKSGVDTKNARWVLNPFCEIAVEEAVRLKERGEAAEVAAVSIGPTAVQEQLRTSCALGADRAVHVETNEELQPLLVAKILAEISKREKADLVLLGKQAVDADNNQTGQMLAGLLNWPQATFASKMEVDRSKGSLRVEQEADRGTIEVELHLPAVVTTDLRLNQPRYATLPNIMKAKKKKIDKIPLEELGITAGAQLKRLGVEKPPERAAGRIVQSVAELIERLRTEAKVI